MENEIVRPLMERGQYDSIRMRLSELLLTAPKTDSIFANIYGNMGKASMLTGNHTLALEDYRNSLKYATRIDDKRHLEAKSLIEIASIYFEQARYDSAEYYALKSESIFNPRKDYYIYFPFHNMIGYIAWTKGDYALAHQSYEKSEAAARKVEICALPYVFTKKAKLLFSEGKYAEQEKVLRESLRLCDSCDVNDLKLVTLATLVELFKKQGKFSESVEAMESLNRLNDKMNLDVMKRAIQQTEIQFKTKLKDQENKNLISLNEEKDRTVEKQKLVLIVAIAALAIFSFLIVLVLRARQRVKRSMLALEIEKQKTETQNLKLEELNALYRKIFSFISHDFQSPLISLGILIDMLNEKKITPEQLPWYSSEVKSQIMQTQQILQNLLNWSWSELSEGKSLQVKKEVNPQTLAEEVVSTLLSLAGRKEIEIQNHIPKDLSLTFNSDLFRIVLRNLLSNAIKYSYEGGQIEIRWDDGKKVFGVKDEGIGMTIEKAATLFSATTQSETGTWSEKGNGLGLYICHEMLTRVGGSLEVNRLDGNGTMFNFSL
jgi:two-component system, sensor histidine kinase and response regulator